MSSENVSIAVGTLEMPCYLSRPAGDDPKPAVIVLQEIFGVNREIRRVSDLLASIGYVTLAINFYHRTHPHLDEPYTQEGAERGGAAAAGVTKASLREDIAAARDWLNERNFVRFNHVGTVGFCFGGTAAFVSATLPGISGAVGFYGTTISRPLRSGDAEALTDAPELRAPLLLFYGGQDQSTPPEAIERVRETLARLGKRFEIVVYEDRGHAFFRESSEALDEGPVADAWRRTQAFLKTSLQ